MFNSKAFLINKQKPNDKKRIIMYVSWRLAKSSIPFILKVLEDNNIDSKLQQSDEQFHLSVGTIDSDSKEAFMKVGDVAIHHQGILQDLQVFLRKDGRGCLVVKVECDPLLQRRDELNIVSETYDGKKFIPHMTLAVDIPSNFNMKQLAFPFQTVVDFDIERVEEFNPSAR